MAFKLVFLLVVASVVAFCQAENGVKTTHDDYKPNGRYKWMFSAWCQVGVQDSDKSLCLDLFHSMLVMLKGLHKYVWSQIGSSDGKMTSSEVSLIQS